MGAVGFLGFIESGLKTGGLGDLETWGQGGWETIQVLKGRLLTAGVSRGSKGSPKNTLARRAMGGKSGTWRHSTNCPWAKEPVGAERLTGHWILLTSQEVRLSK
ncbi:MAG TPA: hypothetical protein DIW47_12935 [Bacteroidetes bacterium]|nr:hypothetical protein [Bacteroidota bacterium]